MHNDFKLVKRKRHRKQTTNCEKINPDSPTNLSRKIENALEEFASSTFCLELLRVIDSCLISISLNSIKEILCFGIGNFLESKSSLHQLAALVTLQKTYNSVVNVYDPVFTSSEIEILKNFNFNIVSENEEGKRKVYGSQGVLVFLPHCPKQLTNNFLWANWNTSLCNCILVANSFSKIIQDNTEKALRESASYILKIHSKAVEIVLEDSYHIENIFNDISVHYIHSPGVDSNFFIETLEEEPAYLEDIEFIRKTIGNVDIKNE